MAKKGVGAHSPPVAHIPPRRALVLQFTEEALKIDANNMMAGKTLVFNLEILSIEKQS